jgi:DNA-directed RNA polymerase specialized sigma24 family protein
MTKKPEITQKDFDRFLIWLDKDKEAAAQKYQSIHRRLVQIFLARNAFPADELADQTIDRAIQKIDYLIKEYDGHPELYIYSIANKIFLEHLRKPKSEPLTDDSIQKETGKDTEEAYFDCLNSCLNNLSPEQRSLFIEYFQYKKQARIEQHKKLAQKLNLDIKALRTRVYRLRVNLEKCVQRCVRKKIV